MRIKLFARVLTVIIVLPVVLSPQPARSQERGLNVSIRAEDGKDIKLYDKSYALVIGVSDYTAGWPKLPGVKKDIEEVARALERQGFQVTKVENPDSAQLDKAFKTFIDEHGLNVENRLLFYFAGHGHTVKQSYGEEMGYIVPVDAPNPNRDPAGFMSKAMDMQQMELYARRIQSKHALFLFDSCFSGALFSLSRAVPDNIGYKTARPVRQFITSGSADEQVPDHSIFREQFIEAIEGEADSNHDGYVTGTELGEFLQDKVVNYSRNAQHPQYGKIRNPNLDKGDFVFALLKAANAPAINVPTNDIDGVWIIGRDGPAVSVVRQGGNVRGTYLRRPGHEGVSGNISGTFDGKTFKGTYENREGNVSSRGSLTLTLKGDQFEGVWTSTTTPAQSGKWLMRRQDASSKTAEPETSSSNDDAAEPSQSQPAPTRKSDASGKDKRESSEPESSGKPHVATISGGVLNGKAISLPRPQYPVTARASHAAGTVTVQVLVDESGRVISARAVGGHALLQAAAEEAARQARFSPTLISGQAVKVTGVITYTFIAQ
jgi:TonB family protein